MKAKTRIKSGDTVVVISGEDKGVKGEVLKVFPQKGKVIVKGANIKRKSIKKSQENPKGGFVENEGLIDLSNVMLFCPEVSKGVRVGIKVEKDGTKKRVAKGCDYIFD